MGAGLSVLIMRASVRKQQKREKERAQVIFTKAPSAWLTQLSCEGLPCHTAWQSHMRSLRVAEGENHPTQGMCQV